MLPSPTTGTSSPPGARHFEVCGPLPAPGVTILEASAGTGKTFTVAALVARLVAEGVAPLSQILAVTFTRMATGELRDRVRERLVSAERGLGRLLDAGEGPQGHDVVLQLMAEGDAEQVGQRRRRLADALAGFDAATITTTHGFCHMVLAALGVWGEVAVGATLLEDPTDLVEEVVDDLFTRYVVRSGNLPFRRRHALEAGLSAVTTPDAPLDPKADMADGSAAGLRRRLGARARDEVRRRLLDANLLTYDDLLVRLANALADAERGPTACLRLRERYRVVLVDEFQDTDPLQWQIVRRAFGDGRTRLVLIGDPKQAIYSFRGADVYAYLEAARAAAPGQRFTLGQNWRSDAGLLSAYDALLSPLHLGHPEIVYRPAQASPAHAWAGLQGAPVTAPLRARLLQRSDRRVVRTRSGMIQKDSAVKFVAEDLASDVVRLLSSGAKLVRRRDDGSPELPFSDIGPGHIGVLVRTNRQAGVVQASLRAAGVPVVVAGALSVFSTPAARDWLRLLEALEQPASRSLAVAAALTPFVGMAPEELARADERSWEALHARLHQWADVVRHSGVAMLFAHITVSERLPARLLCEVDGERLLTDLGHIAELLHAESTQAQLGLAAMRAWLARRMSETSLEGAEVEQHSRRLDSDSDAVQILTVHRAKGLEFPVVYCPYLWDPAPRDNRGGPVVFHDPSDADRRKLDVGGERGDPVYEAHYSASQDERRGEDLRHLYVALTRSRHQTVLWWAGANDCQNSALGRLLLARSPNGDVKGDLRASEARDDRVEAELSRRAARAPGLISVELCGEHPREPFRGGTQDEVPGGMCTATFNRQLDLRWRRSSYTSITAAAHALGQMGDGDPLVDSEPEDTVTHDEPVAGSVETSPDSDRAGTAPGPGVAQQLREASSMLSGMPVGPAFGTFVHRVLERVDFSAPDLTGALLGVLGEEWGRSPGGESIDLPTLAKGLAVTISTPLGGPAGGARLRDIGPLDRLDELAFELPLAGGDSPVGEVLTLDVANLFASHVGPGQALAGYASDLSRPHLATDLRGYLTGSLDLVFRLRPRGEHERYFVVDYKTNWLGGPGDDLVAWDYRPSALEAEMRRSHYPLQALFYLVALHRYLRWRLPGYDPALNLGGALYLFLRGMACPGAPAVEGQPCGVFAWHPPVGLVTGLSDLLAGPPGSNDGH